MESDEKDEVIGTLRRIAAELGTESVSRPEFLRRSGLPSVIAQACGYPFVSSEELARLLDKLDYPTLLKFNRQARRSGVSGPMLAAELMRVLDERES